MEKIKLAIVGCGKVTESTHLPALSMCPEFEVSMLVDKSLDRAELLSKEFKISNITNKHQDVIGNVDAAVVAVPHHLHASIASDLLRNGVHVLLEKPMALTLSECDLLIDSMIKTNVVLFVGHVRRYYDPIRKVKEIIETRKYGDIRKFDFIEGNIFNWPAVSNFIYNKEKGGGVLMDTGSHVLDTLLWWLGDYSSVDYYDDAMGGVEANCEIHIKMNNGSSGKVELSRTRELRNSYILRFDKYFLEVGIQFNSSIKTYNNHNQLISAIEYSKKGDGEYSILTTFKNQYVDFYGSIVQNRQPYISGYEGKKVIDLIENCYRVRKNMSLPWSYFKQCK